MIKKLIGMEKIGIKEVKSAYYHTMKTCFSTGKMIISAIITKPVVTESFPVVIKRFPVVTLTFSVVINRKGAAILTKPVVINTKHEQS